jgi:hypothetical protein|tara:strand:- start:587 stop:1447 length:861 start_codon:yes stop_codon:yes gene_type:complete
MPHKEDDYSGVKDPSVIHEEILMPSTIENIDMALFEYIDNKLNLSCTTNKGFEKVPVIWVSAERAFQIKNNKGLRDANGSVILPVLTVERGGISKDLSRKGGIYGGTANTDSSIVIARRIKQDKTRNFANADAKRINKQNNYPRKNNKVVYETATIPLPTYIDVSYTIGIRTEYQQQLNEIVAPFLNIGRPVNYFTIRRNMHTYEGFIESDFSLDTNITNLSDEERRYETKINIKVLGYLIGDDKNQNTPKIVYRENAVDVRIGRERVIVGDKPWNISPEKVKYRD